MTQCSLEALKLLDVDVQPTESVVAPTATSSEYLAILEELERLRLGHIGVGSSRLRTANRHKAAEKVGLPSYFNVVEDQATRSVLLNIFLFDSIIM